MNAPLHCLLVNSLPRPGGAADCACYGRLEFVSSCHDRRVGKGGLIDEWIVVWGCPACAEFVSTAGDATGVALRVVNTYRLPDHRALVAGLAGELADQERHP